MKKKAALAAALLFCICSVTSQAANGHAIAKRVLDSIHNIIYLGAQPCRIDFDIKGSVFANGIEQKDREKNETTYLLLKDYSTYKLKISETNVIVHKDFKCYAAGEDKLAAELPDTMQMYVEMLVSHFDSHYYINYLCDTVFNRYKLLPPTNVDGKACDVLEISVLDETDTTIIYIDKGTSLVKKAILKRIVSGSSGTLTYTYDYTIAKDYGIVRELVMENEEQGEKHVTTFTLKKYVEIDDMSDEEFNYKIVKIEE